MASLFETQECVTCASYSNACHVVTDPGIMKKFRVDRGAIKFVLAGANIMCPGLTSAGGALDDDVPADAPVVSTSCPTLRITGFQCPVINLSYC